MLLICSVRRSRDHQILKDFYQYMNHSVSMDGSLADHPKIKLMELAIPSFLRPVVAETLAKRVEFHRLRQLVHAHVQ